MGDAPRPIMLSEERPLFALRWTAAEPGSFQFPFLDLDRARNWQEFTAALARFPGPGQNFVYADMDGNIGYHAAGMLPIRKNYDGDVPVDGSSGDYEWQATFLSISCPRPTIPRRAGSSPPIRIRFRRIIRIGCTADFAAPYRSLEIRSLLHGS